MRKPVLLFNLHTYESVLGNPRIGALIKELDVHVLSTFYGVRERDPRWYPHVTVCDLGDREVVDSAVDWIVSKYGIGYAVAVHESALLMAARARTQHGLPGLGIDEVMRFRDKVLMKTILQDAGISVPKFVSLTSEDVIDTVNWERGAHIIKSRWGTGGRYSQIANNRHEALAWWRANRPAPDSYEMEEFVDGEMLHCDAITQQGAVVFASVGKYIFSPGGFASRTMGGSYLLKPGALEKSVVAFNGGVLRALGVLNGVTHLEVFSTPNNELIFCEIAIRPGGGEIDRLNELAHGISILEAAIRLECELDLRLQISVPTSPSIFVRVGFYPPREPRIGGGCIEVERWGEFSIVDHGSSTTAGSTTMGYGAPRHSSDFRDWYIFCVEDENSVSHQVAAISAAYTQATSVR